MGLRAERPAWWQVPDGPPRDRRPKRRRNPKGTGGLRCHAQSVSARPGGPPCRAELAQQPPKRVAGRKRAVECLSGSKSSNQASPKEKIPLLGIQTSPRLACSSRDPMEPRSSEASSAADASTRQRRLGAARNRCPLGAAPARLTFPNPRSRPPARPSAYIPFRLRRRGPGRTLLRRLTPRVLRSRPSRIPHSNRTSRTRRERSKGPSQLSSISRTRVSSSPSPKKRGQDRDGSVSVMQVQFPAGVRCQTAVWAGPRELAGVRLNEST